MITLSDKEKMEIEATKPQDGFYTSLAESVHDILSTRVKRLPRLKKTQL